MLRKRHLLWSDITCLHMYNQYVPNVTKKIKDTWILRDSTMKPTSMKARENIYFTNN